jgi:transcriptional regulator with GAF, ATPase, and Fis domain
LHIYKEGFVVEYKLTDTKESEKVCINFQEDEEAKTTEAKTTEAKTTEAKTTEANTEAEAKAEDEEKIRHEMKQKVLQARQRAARALFKAEELMHTFVEKYGMDTDWEDEDD